MTIQFRLKSMPVRFSLLTATILLYIIVIFFILRLFIVGTLTDDRVKMNRRVLTSAVEYFPKSSALHKKRAEVELQEQERDLPQAEQHCLAAIRLSPHDYHGYLLLGLIQEWQGDRAAAEISLRSALGLAPNNLTVHWQLANLLVREGKLQEAVNYFNNIAKKDSQLLPAIFDLIWQSSNHNLALMRDVAGSDSGTLLWLARTLLKNSQPAEAGIIFQSIDRSARLSSNLSREFIEALILQGKANEARPLWIDLVSEDPSAKATAPLIWNGSFESTILTNLAQFDWSIEQSDYARILITQGISHSGKRSLKIEFSGRDTTRLDKEINQLVLLHRGIRYRLEFYVRSREFVSSQGPRVVVTEEAASTWLASSDAIKSGSNDWQRITFEFVVPASNKEEITSANISVKRKPEFSFDEPTRGAIWLDDFQLSEIRKAQ